VTDDANTPEQARPADFLAVTTPAATQVMRSPDEGIPRSRFRPPVHVSIWS